MSAEAQILKVVLDNNRPFGLQNLVDLTAHLGLKKAAVTKALDTLVEQGKVIAKEFGKTKIFIPPQGDLQVLTKEEADAKKAQIRELQEQLSAESAACRDAEQELAQLQNSLTEEQIAEQTATATKKLKELEDKLQLLRGGAVLITPEERKKVEDSLTRTMEAWRKRKGMFRGVWDGIAEGLDGKQSDLFEEIGVDTDEAMGISIATVEQLMPNKRRKVGGGR